MKKKNLILSFLLILSSQRVASAQELANPLSAKIDSIQGLLDAQPRQDTVRIKRLNDLARNCFDNSAFERGLIATKQARQLSEKLGYRKGEGLYLRTMALFHYFDELSFFYHIHTRWYYKELRKKEPLIDKYFSTLFFSPITTDYAHANTQLFAALKYFKQEQDKEIVAHILYAIGSNCLRLNETSEAMGYLEQALKQFKEIGRNELVFFVLVNKMTGLQRNNKIKEANEIENEAKVIIANTENVREKAFLNYYMAYIYLLQNKIALSFEIVLKTDYELEKIGEKEFRPTVLESLGSQFHNLAMYQKSLYYFKKAIELNTETKNFNNIGSTYFGATFLHISMKKFDEAKQFLDKAKLFTDKFNNPQLRAYTDFRYHDASGQILIGFGKYQEALIELYRANKLAENLNMKDFFSMYINSYIANCYQKLGELQESIFFAEKSYQQSLTLIIDDERILKNNCLMLSEAYEKSGQFKQAFEYLKKYRSILKEKEEQDIANLTANLEIDKIIQKNDQERASFEKEKLIKEKENQNQRWWLFSVAAALLSSFVFLYILYRTNQNKQKANAILEKTLSKLQSTQAQLIQSEKLASLGELTAGIAHEIQNPLNFVNNFAEVSAEMLDEMHEELEKGDTTEAIAIATDLKTNLEKINHHGQRASSIVKGMLEHSRASTGVKEPTDLNALADEFLRLAYHGLRAKDDNFNATMETHFDPDLPKVSVIPQDIGRVLLNLINNAFYAVAERSRSTVDEKQKQMTRVESGTPLSESFRLSESYTPTISLRTKRLDNAVEIRIKDNGPGIPEAIKDKIFQPFFTTKPTGQGTGLGLSLAYDIITKGHAGNIKLASSPSEGSEFIVKLPL